MNVILEQINSTGKAFVEFALAGLVQSSVLIVILLLVDLALRRKVRAVFRYWLWMLVLAKLVLPTSLSSPVSLGHWFGDKLQNIKIVRQTTAVNLQELQQPTELEPIEVGIPTPPVISPPAEIIKPSVMPEIATEPTVPARTVTPVTWQGVVFLVWLAVVGAMGLLLLQRAIFVRGLVAQAREANSLMKDAFEFCRKQMGVKRKVALKVSANAMSPAVCGIWCYVILLPRNLGRSLGSRDLRAVLLHELAHIKRGDLWVNFVQTVLQIIYFYNPLLWLANAVIRRVREQAVDEAVLVAMGEKAQWYPQTLVSVAKLAFKRPALSLRLIGVVESKSALTSRIKRILNRPIPKTAKLGILGLAALIIMAAILLPMAGSKPNIGEGPEREVTVTLGWTGEQVKIPAQVVFPDWGRETRKFKRWMERIGDVREFKTYDTDGYKYVLSVHGVIEEADGSRRASIANVLRYNPGGVLEAGSSYFAHGVPGQWWTCDEDGQKNIRVLNRPRAKECKKEVRFYGPDGKKTKEWHISEFDVVYGEMIFEPDGRTHFSHFLKELIHSPYPKRFTATLPNGVTVELVGVCEHPSEGKQWWGPDGALLKEAPYDKIEAPTFTLEQLFSGMTGKLQQIELALRIITPTETPPEVGWRMESPGRIYYLERILKKGRIAPQIKALLAAVSSEDKTIEVKLHINDSWIKFKNVSLQPGMKTDVQFQVEGAAAVSAESEVGPVPIVHAVQKKAMLPNGVTVELVGLCSGLDTKERIWWRPNGLSAKSDDFQIYNQDIKAMTWEDRPDRQFKYAYVFKVSQSDNTSVDTDVSVGTRWHGNYTSDRSVEIGYVYSDSGNVNDFPFEGGIKVAVATGDYEQFESKVYNGVVNDTSILSDRTTNVTISGPRDYPGYSEKLIDVTLASNEYDVAVIYELTDGTVKDTRPESRMGGPYITSFFGEQNPLIRHSFQVSDPWEQIKKFVVKYRRYQLATFKNVSLKPRVKTDVEVEEGGSAAGLENANRLTTPIALSFEDATEKGGRFAWTFDIDPNLRFSHGWYSTEDGQIREHVGAGTSTVPARGQIKLALQVKTVDDMLEINIERREKLEDGQGTTSVKSKTAIPAGTVLRSTCLSVPSMLTEKHLKLWEGQFVKDAKVIKSVVFSAYLFSPSSNLDDGTIGFYPPTSPSDADAEVDGECKHKAEQEEEIKRTNPKIISSAARKSESVEEFVAALVAGSQVSVENINGSIKVGGEETRECRIKATIEVKAKNENETRKLMEKVKVQVRQSGKILSVRVEQPKLRRKQSVKVDFEITVPKKSNLDLHTNNGEIEIADISGEIESKTNNGAIEAVRIAGDTLLHTNNGKVNIRKADLTPGAVTVNNGAINCEEILGNIQVQVNNGKVKVSYARTAPSVCNVSITTNNGDIDFTGPANFSAAVEAETQIGSITTNLPLTVKGWMGKSASGTLGKGEGKLNLETSTGSIRIR